MSMHIGNAQGGRIFYGTSPVREIFEGSRKIMGYDSAIPNTNLFSWSGGWSASNGSGNCGFSIPNMNNISGSAQTIDYCDDITFNTFESGIYLNDMTGSGVNLSVSYLSETQIIGADKIFIVVNFQGSQVAKVQGGGYTNTRIRAWYDLPTKTFKVQLDSTVIYTSPQIEWRPWRLGISLGFLYYPPQIIPGYPPIMIDGMFVGGWVTVYGINKAVGYPRA